MTPFLGLVKRTIEKVLGRYYEGPEPPDRLRQFVLAFAASRPRATKREWIEFAGAFAAQSYRAGYERGYGWADRDLDRRDPEYDPELATESRLNDWSWLDPEDEPAPSGLDDVPEPEDQDAEPEPEE